MSKELDSKFALLDVKKGRRKLSKYFENGGKPIPVTIRGFIVDQNSGDDVTSIEFVVDVKSAKVRKR